MGLMTSRRRFKAAKQKKVAAEKTHFGEILPEHHRSKIVELPPEVEVAPEVAEPAPELPKKAGSKKKGK